MLVESVKSRETSGIAHVHTTCILVIMLHWEYSNRNNNLDTLPPPLPPCFPPCFPLTPSPARILCIHCEHKMTGHKLQCDESPSCNTWHKHTLCKINHSSLPPDLYMYARINHLYVLTMLLITFNNLTSPLLHRTSKLMTQSHCMWHPVWNLTITLLTCVTHHDGTDLNLYSWIWSAVSLLLTLFRRNRNNVEYEYLCIKDQDPRRTWQVGRERGGVCVKLFYF